MPIRLTSACHDMKFTQWESVQVLWRSRLFSLMRSQGSWHSLLKRRLAGENWSQQRKKHAPAPYGLNYFFHASGYSPRKFLLFSLVHTEHSATCFILHFVEHIQHGGHVIYDARVLRPFKCWGRGFEHCLERDWLNIFLYNFIPNYWLNLFRGVLLFCWLRI